MSKGRDQECPILLEVCAGEARFAPIGAALRSAVIVLLSLLLSPTCTLDASATDLEGNKMHLDAEIIIRTPTIPSVEEGRRLIAARQPMRAFPP